MLRIVRCGINRYRSILSMTIEISNDSNLVAICGQNNVGKTNTLRAINLFFHPEFYDRAIDMPKIKKATGGQSIHPKIEITFFDDNTNTYYTLCRDIKSYLESNEDGLSGTSNSSDKKHGRKKLSLKEIYEVLDKIEFVYIESINIFIPDLINKISEGIIDVEYDSSRFSQSKKDLKEAYDTYIEGLKNILGAFAKNISHTFKSFHDNWNVEFIVPKNSDTFRDLISEDVRLSLNDEGCVGILDKGAGLQRLATILLNFEMLSRIKKEKNFLICIDEPDAYLHEGLQRKLKNLFDEKSSKMQLIFTTHSKVFINEYNMTNVFLLDSLRRNQFSVRKKKEIVVAETILVNLDSQEGYDKICSHLGIEAVVFELLQPYNIIVEGNCDKKYLTELFSYFNLKCPNIESLNGADNALKYLEFYDSYYHNNTTKYKPKITVLLDNDPKGREVFSKIQSKRYNHIDVYADLLKNYNGDCNSNKNNNEIEDFVYPEVIVFLINALLERKNMRKLNSNSICKKIQQPSFSKQGILELCEFEKNNANPKLGVDISFTSSKDSTNKIKEGLAGMFNLRGNKKLLSLIQECDKKYPYVKSFLETLAIPR